VSICHFGNNGHINNINNMSVIWVQMWRACRGKLLPGLVPPEFVKPLVVDSEVMGNLVDDCHRDFLHHVLA
jgi:hypothetical protein